MPDPKCTQWKKLLTYPGNDDPAFGDFAVDRGTLTRHLLGCIDCQNLIRVLPATADIIPDEQMNYDEFSHAIRELWKLTRPKKKRI